MSMGRRWRQWREARWKLREVAWERRFYTCQAGARGSGRVVLVTTNDVICNGASNVLLDAARVRTDV